MVQQMIEDAKRASAANSSTCAWWRCAWTCDKSLHPHQADLPSQAQTIQHSARPPGCPAPQIPPPPPLPVDYSSLLEDLRRWIKALHGVKQDVQEALEASAEQHSLPLPRCCCIVAPVTGAAQMGVCWWPCTAHKAAALLTSRIRSPVHHPACVCVQEAHHRVDENQETMGAANPEDQEEWHRLMWLKCDSTCCCWSIVWMRRAACGMMLWPGYRLWRTWSCRQHTIHWADSWLAWVRAQSAHAWHARART